jgi:hypothetical protein
MLANSTSPLSAMMDWTRLRAVLDSNSMRALTLQAVTSHERHDSLESITMADTKLVVALDCRLDLLLILGSVVCDIAN